MASTGETDCASESESTGDDNGDTSSDATYESAPGTRTAGRTSGLINAANDEPDTVTAMSPDGGLLVVVHVNHGPFVRHLTVDLPNRRTGSWTVETIVSDASRDARQIGSPRTGADPVLIAPPLSVSTFILRRSG